MQQEEHEITATHLEAATRHSEEEAKDGATARWSGQHAEMYAADDDEDVPADTADEDNAKRTEANDAVASAAVETSMHSEINRLNAALDREIHQQQQQNRQHFQQHEHHHVGDYSGASHHHHDVSVTSTTTDSANNFNNGGASPQVLVERLRDLNDKMDQVRGNIESATALQQLEGDTLVDNATADARRLVVEQEQWLDQLCNRLKDHVTQVTFAITPLVPPYVPPQQQERGGIVPVVNPEDRLIHMLQGAMDEVQRIRSLVSDTMQKHFHHQQQQHGGQHAMAPFDASQSLSAQVQLLCHHVATTMGEDGQHKKSSSPHRMGNTNKTKKGPSQQSKSGVSNKHRAGLSSFSTVTSVDGAVQLAKERFRQLMDLLGSGDTSFDTSYSHSGDASSADDTFNAACDAAVAHTRRLERAAAENSIYLLAMEEYEWNLSEVLAPAGISAIPSVKDTAQRMLESSKGRYVSGSGVGAVASEGSVEPQVNQTAKKARAGASTIAPHDPVNVRDGAQAHIHRRNVANLDVAASDEAAAVVGRLRLQHQRMMQDVNWVSSHVRSLMDLGDQLRAAIALEATAEEDGGVASSTSPQRGVVAGAAALPAHAHTAVAQRTRDGAASALADMRRLVQQLLHSHHNMKEATRRSLRFATAVIGGGDGAEQDLQQQQQQLPYDHATANALVVHAQNTNNANSLFSNVEDVARRVADFERFEGNITDKIRHEIAPILPRECNVAGSDAPLVDILDGVAFALKMQSSLVASSLLTPQVLLHAISTLDSFFTLAPSSTQSSVAGGGSGTGLVPSHTPWGNIMDFAGITPQAVAMAAQQQQQQQQSLNLFHAPVHAPVRHADTNEGGSGSAAVVDAYSANLQEAVDALQHRIETVASRLQFRVMHVDEECRLATDVVRQSCTHVSRVLTSFGGGRNDARPDNSATAYAGAGPGLAAAKGGALRAPDSIDELKRATQQLHHLVTSIEGVTLDTMDQQAVTQRQMEHNRGDRVKLEQLFKLQVQPLLKQLHDAQALSHATLPKDGASADEKEKDEGEKERQEEEQHQQFASVGRASSVASNNTTTQQQRETVANFYEPLCKELTKQVQGLTSKHRKLVYHAQATKQQLGNTSETHRVWHKRLNSVKKETFELAKLLDVTPPSLQLLSATSQTSALNASTASQQQQQQMSDAQAGDVAAAIVDALKAMQSKLQSDEFRDISGALQERADAIEQVQQLTALRRRETAEFAQALDVFGAQVTTSTAFAQQALGIYFPVEETTENNDDGVAENDNRNDAEDTGRSASTTGEAEDDKSGSPTRDKKTAASTSVNVAKQLRRLETTCSRLLDFSKDALDTLQGLVSNLHRVHAVHCATDTEVHDGCLVDLQQTILRLVDDLMLHARNTQALRQRRRALGAAKKEQKKEEEEQHDPSSPPPQRRAPSNEDDEGATNDTSAEQRQQEEDVEDAEAAEAMLAEVLAPDHRLYRIHDVANKINTKLTAMKQIKYLAVETSRDAGGSATVPLVSGVITSPPRPVAAGTGASSSGDDADEASPERDPTTSTSPSSSSRQQQSSAVGALDMINSTPYVDIVASMRNLQHGESFSQNDVIRTLEKNLQYIERKVEQLGTSIKTAAIVLQRDVETAQPLIASMLESLGTISVEHLGLDREAVDSLVRFLKNKSACQGNYFYNRGVDGAEGASAWGRGVEWLHVGFDPVVRSSVHWMEKAKEYRRHVDRALAVVEEHALRVMQSEERRHEAKSRQRRGELAGEDGENEEEEDRRRDGAASGRPPLSPRRDGDDDDEADEGKRSSKDQQQQEVVTLEMRELPTYLKQLAQEAELGQRAQQLEVECDQLREQVQMLQEVKQIEESQVHVEYRQLAATNQQLMLERDTSQSEAAIARAQWHRERDALSRQVKLLEARVIAVNSGSGRRAFDNAEDRGEDDDLDVYVSPSQRGYSPGDKRNTKKAPQQHQQHEADNKKKRKKIVYDPNGDHGYEKPTFAAQEKDIRHARGRAAALTEGYGRSGTRTPSPVVRVPSASSSGSGYYGNNATGHASERQQQQKGVRSMRQHRRDEEDSIIANWIKKLDTELVQRHLYKPSDEDGKKTKQRSGGSSQRATATTTRAVTSSRSSSATKQQQQQQQQQQSRRSSRSTSPVVIHSSVSERKREHEQYRGDFRQWRADRTADGAADDGDYDDAHQTYGSAAVALTFQHSQSSAQPSPHRWVKVEQQQSSGRESPQNRRDRRINTAAATAVLVVPSAASEQRRAQKHHHHHQQQQQEQGHYEDHSSAHRSNSNAHQLQQSGGRQRVNDNVARLIGDLTGTTNAANTGTVRETAPTTTALAPAAVESRPATGGRNKDHGGSKRAIVADTAAAAPASASKPRWQR